MAPKKEPPQLLANRVIAARIEGMTPAQSTDGQPSTPNHSVARDRLVGVLRARRVESARRRQHSREGKLVQANCSKCECFHQAIRSVARIRVRVIYSAWLLEPSVANGN